MDKNEHLCAWWCEIIIWSTASLADRNKTPPTRLPESSSLSVFVPLILLVCVQSGLPACSSVLFYLPVASCTVGFPPPVSSALFGRPFLPPPLPVSLPSFFLQAVSLLAGFF